MDTVEYIPGGIQDIKRLRGFITSLSKDLKNIFVKEYVMTERENSLFSQEDVELSFISDYWDELVEEGWLEEC